MNDGTKLRSMVMNRLTVPFAHFVHALELDRPDAAAILPITVAELFGFFSFLGVAILLSGLLA